MILIVSVVFKTVVLRKPDTRLIYTAQEETFLETVQVSGIFHKTATETEKATAYAAYQSAISALTRPDKTRKQPILQCGQKDRPS